MIASRLLIVSCVTVVFVAVGVGLFLLVLDLLAPILKALG
jgi:hypothetical protein